MECNEPLQDGASGDLVSTGLLNVDMPLIRYKVGDRGSINTECDKCLCGRKLPEISRIEGRANDVLVAPDGRRVFWLNPVFYGLPVREAQIIQETLDNLKVKYVPAPGFSPQVEHSIIDRLYARMGKVEVNMERVDAIPRGPNGKFRAVISNLSKKEWE
jgi:phenylacetate-CoA ligase